MTRVCPAGTVIMLGSPNPPLSVSPKGTLGTSSTRLGLEFFAEVECGFIIVPAIATPANNAAKAKCVLNLFILLSPFD
jgi:hypothetical protein